MSVEPPVSVLIIDDNPDDRLLARRALAREIPGLELHEVGTLDDYQRQLASNGFDVVITDYQLRWSDGITVLREITQRFPHIPVIMFTNTGGEEVVVQGMKEGLFDYIVKTPDHFIRLPAAVKGAIRSNALQRRLVASETRHLAIGDSVPYGVWLAGPDGGMQYLSQSFLDLLGMTLHEARGLGWLGRLRADDSRAIESRWHACVAERRDWEAELEVPGSDGRIHAVLSRGRPMIGPGDQLLGYAGLHLDITERRQLQQDRERLLESERVARYEAERANRVKDEFLAVVSHELRTPLNAILGWAAMLGTGRLSDADTKQAMKVIERNARAQAQLIEDLLDMSRIVSGKLRLDLQLVDPAAPVGAAVQAVRPMAEAKGLRLEEALADDAAPIRGDAGRLQQIALNLLTNAVKFTPSGGRIHISLARAASRSVLTVSDTGEGIEPALIPTLFDRFHQSETATTRRFGGLGLGLPLVKHLAEMQGGAVQAHSDGPGAGATFTVSFPIAAVAAHGETEPVPPRDPEVSLAGLRVVIVDDDADSLDLLARILRGRGAEVLTADRAQGAFDLVRTRQPDLLVSDIGMPNEDGYGLIARIRDLPEADGRRTPAIALTAFARGEDRQRALLAGFQMHLSKPAEPNELVAAAASLAFRRARA